MEQADTAVSHATRATAVSFMSTALLAVLILKRYL